MFAKAIESIHRFGFVDPVTVRDLTVHHGPEPEDRREIYQIIDGEHRWRGAREHSGACVKIKSKYTEHIGLRQIPIANLGVLEDSVAKQLTIVLNETRGDYRPKEMGVLLTSLLAAEPLPELLEVLPFTPERFQELAELPKINWDDLTGSKPGGGSGSGGGGKMVERVYRLPTDAAEKLDEAVRAARDEESTPDWRALQTLAEHFLGS